MDIYLCEYKYSPSDYIDGFQILGLYSGTEDEVREKVLQCEKMQKILSDELRSNENIKGHWKRTEDQVKNWIKNNINVSKIDGEPIVLKTKEKFCKDYNY